MPDGVLAHPLKLCYHRENRVWERRESKMKSKKDWKGSIGLALLIIAAVTVVILCFYGARQTAPPESGAPAAAAEPVQAAGNEAAAPADKVAAGIR